MRYITIDGNTATVKVDGCYDLCNTLDVQFELDTAFMNGCTKVVVDFGNTTEIDSSVLMSLQKVRDRTGDENFEVKRAKDKVLEKLTEWKLVR